MTGAGVVLAALVLDALLGEPRWLWARAPHPAVLMGRAVATLDRTWNHPPRARLAGVAALSVLVTGALIVGFAVAHLPPAGVWTVLLGAALLAQRSLATHVADVADALRLSLGDGRIAVARIVGRDTTEMDETAVARAALESAFENLSDGVVAPIFWFLLAGLPGLVVYKAVNTADSMIGYRTPRHEAFGWAAARFDDVLNWVPARLTAVLIAGMTGGLRHLGQIAADARRHRSPNAGWPEAAAARALDVALAGPRSYHGTLQDFPLVHPAGRRDIGADAIDAGVVLLWRVWWGVALGVGLLAIVSAA